MCETTEQFYLMSTKSAVDAALCTALQNLEILSPKMLLIADITLQTTGLYINTTLPEIPPLTQVT